MGKKHWVKISVSAHCCTRHNAEPPSSVSHSPCTNIVGTLQERLHDSNPKPVVHFSRPHLDAGSGRHGPQFCNIRCWHVPLLLRFALEIPFSFFWGTDRWQPDSHNESWPSTWSISPWVYHSISITHHWFEMQHISYIWCQNQLNQTKRKNVLDCNDSQLCWTSWSTTQSSRTVLSH